jgi:hypothetical protein
MINNSITIGSYDFAITTAATNYGVCSTANLSSVVFYRHIVTSPATLAGISCLYGQGCTLNNSGSIGPITTGISIQYTQQSTATGAFSKDATNNVFMQGNTAISFTGVYARNGTYGIRLDPGGAHTTGITMMNTLVDGASFGYYITNTSTSLVDTEINNSTTRAFNVLDSKVSISGSLVGISNAGWGLNLTGTRTLFILDITPTLVGASGEFTIDGSLDLTWAGAATYSTMWSDQGVTTVRALQSNSTTDIGWTVQTHANQACNTTCIHGCVFGENTAALTYEIVDCADATADRCICAGGS